MTARGRLRNRQRHRRAVRQAYLRLEPKRLITEEECDAWCAWAFAAPGWMRWTFLVFPREADRADREYRRERDKHRSLLRRRPR